jgi:creatinine amidohydrolase/Fe(II)-dependent formamide hydrolase-like protein
VTDHGGNILLAEMTSAQVRAELGRGRSTVVVPFGAVEQHGPHLPLDTDALLSDRLGPLLAERLGGNRACLALARKLLKRSYHTLRELGDEALQPA